MEREQIIKALECCIKAETWGDCKDLGCPALQKQGCYFYLRTDEDEENTIYIEIFKDVIVLIKELTEENEKLREVEALEAELSRYTENVKQMCEQAKADTVRKMQERLKAEAGYFGRAVAVEVIDQIAEEMLEEE